VKHSGWNRALSEDGDPAPEAVTIRPDIGSAQFAHVAVGTPLRADGFSHGSRDDVFSVASLAGIVFEGWGKGRVLEGGTLTMLEDGRSVQSVTAEMGSSSGRMMVGHGAGVSDTLIVGTAGADTVKAGVTAEGLGPGRPASRLSCFAASSGFQLRSKLTIGRPGRSLTAVGMGSFGLLSLSFMLVAARMSSPRISIPFLLGGVSASGMTSMEGVTEFLV